MVPHMVHLQDVVKLHTFVLGHLGALLLACFGFDLRFAPVAFDLVSDSIWCEGVGVGVGARGGSTGAGEDYLRGALGWERRANLRTTNKARSHTHTQAQATQPLDRGPPTPIPTAIQQSLVSARERPPSRSVPPSLSKFTGDVFGARTELWDSLGVKCSVFFVDCKRLSNRCGGFPMFVLR